MKAHIFGEASVFTDTVVWCSDEKPTLEIEWLKRDHSFAPGYFSVIIRAPFGYSSFRINMPAEMYTAFMSSIPGQDTKAWMDYRETMGQEVATGESDGE